jgi:hypothetical protein
MISARITDGTITVNLNDGDPFEILELDLGYGDPSEREISGSMRLYANGNSPSMGMDGPIPALRTAVQSLQKLLQQAIHYWRYDKGAQIMDSDASIVYLEVKIAGTEDYYRTPITQARYAMPNDSTWNLSIGGTNPVIEYVIDFARKNWWEGPEEQLDLKSITYPTASASVQPVWNPKPFIEDTAGTAITFTTGADNRINDASNRMERFPDGSTIFVRNSTSNDGAYTVTTSTAAYVIVAEAVNGEGMPAGGFLMGSEPGNWVQVTKGDLSGDLPAPTRIEVTNTNANDLYELWIGHWFQIPPTEQLIVLEAEDGNYDYISDLVDATDPPASEGSYIEYDEPFPAQKITYGYCSAGSTTARVQLSLAESAADDYYDNYVLYIVSDPNGLTGLYRTITDYQKTSTQRYADISPVLPSAPTTSTQYAIYAPGTTNFTNVSLVPIYWSIDGNSMPYYRGRYFKAILKLYDDSGSPDDYNYQLRMRHDISSEIIWEGPIVRYGYDTDLQARDLGTFRMPPTWTPDAFTGPVILELVLTPFDTTVTEVNGIRIDFLMLLPVDGFRYHKIISGVPQNNMITDDGYKGIVYYTTSSDIYGDIIGRGSQIMLQPGISQRLYFFLGEDIERTASVSLYYRPRRLSI